jgi:hypothetical protein
MGYMMRKAVADHWRETGSLPPWDPYILGGLPVVDAMHGDLFYPLSAFYLFMPLHKALGWKIVIHVWLAGLTMYFLLRTLGLRRRSAALGGLGYMVAPYLLSLIYAGHDAKMFVTALFPLAVLLLERLIRNPRLVCAGLFGGAIGLLLLTSHPQMAYFASWGLGIYLVCSIPRLIRERKLARGGLMLALAVAIGLSIGCVQFLPTYHYTTNFSPRTGGVSFEYASSWSLHPEEIASLLYPAFGGYIDTYWGRNAFKINAESPGPMVLLLAVAGFVSFIRRKELLPWHVLFIFCPVYALGAHTPLFKLVFYAVPGARFLRAPSLIMFMFSSASAVLAAFFIDSLFDPKPGSRHRRISIVLAAVLVVMLILATVGKGALISAWKVFYSGLDSTKIETMAGSANALALDAVLLALFGGGLFLAAATAYRRRWKGAVPVAAICAGILVTSLIHGFPFIDYMEVSDFVRTDPMIDYIRSDREPFRALPLTSSSYYNRNYLPLFGIETANGFYDNRIRFYDALTGSDRQNLLEPRIMSIANVKYLLTTQRVRSEALTLEKDLGSAFVYRNRYFLPRAFIVHRAEVVEDDTAALELIRSGEFDPSSAIVLHEGRPLEGPAGIEGEGVVIERDDPYEVVLRVRVKQPGYVFYSGNYLPGWRAWVDGMPAPVVRSNISMRAVPVEPGEHTVRMRYSSRWFRVGSLICMAGCTGIFLIAMTAWRSYRRGQAGA